MANPVDRSHVRVLDGHVLDAGTSSKDKLVCDLVGQAESGPEIAIGGRADSKPAICALRHPVEFDRPAIVSTDAWIRKGRVEAGELSPVLLEGHLHVPAQADVQGQPRQDLPVVLKVQGVICLPLFQREARSRSDKVGQAEVKVGQMKSARAVCVLGLATEVPFRHAKQVGAGRAHGQAPCEAALVMPVDAPELALVAELDGVPPLVPESAVGPVRDQLRLPVRGRVRTDRDTEAGSPRELDPRTFVARHARQAELARQALAEVVLLSAVLLEVEPE